MSCNSISIIGFGNQAQAWAHNLRDAGVKILIGLRKNSTHLELVKKNNFEIKFLEDSKLYQFPCALLIPDHEHIKFFEDNIKSIPQNSTFIYAHGHSVIKHQLQQKYSEFHHILFAPKAIATELRNRFLTKEDLGGVYSLEFVKKDDYLPFIKDLAKKIGLTLGPYQVSFKEETMADLFSEQSFLCSLIPYVALESYNLLRKKGVSKELAYLEVWMEVDLIVKTLVKVGPQKFFELISPNALVGSEKGRATLMDKDFLNHLKSLIDDIETSDFDEEVSNTSIPDLRQMISQRWGKEEFTQTIKTIQGLT